MLKRRSAAERIRADVVAYVEQHEPVTRNAIVRDVVGRSESIIATLHELATEGELRHEAGRYMTAGAASLPDAAAEAAERHRQREAAHERWRQRWLDAGMPVPESEWERSGRPGRDEWAARGGRFRYLDCGELQRSARVAAGELIDGPLPEVAEPCRRSDCWSCA